MADANRPKLHPSLPANYVSFLDLRDRWMKQQQQMDRERKEPDDEPRPKTIEVEADVERVEALVDEDKGFVADRLLESESPPQLAAESVVRSNPNPKNATRRPFHGQRRPTEKGHHDRWVQVSQTKSPPVLPLKKPNHAPKIQANQSKPDPKALPVLQSKPPPLEAPEVDQDVQVPTEIHSSDKEVSDSRFRRGKGKKKKQWVKMSKKRNQEEDLVQSQPEKGVLAPNDDLEERAKLTVQPEKALAVLQSKPPPLEPPEVDHAVQVPTEIHSSDKEVSDSRFRRGKGKKKQWGKRSKKSNQEEDLVQSQPEKGVLAPNDDLEERAKLTVQPEKPQPLKAPKVVRSVQPRDEIHGSGEMVNDPNVEAKAEKKKKKSKYNRRNQKVEDVIQSQPKKDPQSPNVDLDEAENSKQEIDSVRENKDDADNSKAEMEAKFAGLSLGCASEESSSHRSAAARYRRGWRKDGSFAKFERRVMLKQEQAKTESGLVWVKKGEDSQIGAVAVMKARSLMV